jgi:hypothetical protein
VAFPPDGEAAPGFGWVDAVEGLSVPQSQSRIYSNRLLYHLIMRLLYGRHFEARYAAIAAEITAGAGQSVVDVCAGDAYLYLKYLRSKPVQYLGLDFSPQMVRWAQQHGASMRVFDVWREEVPAGDVVVMQASLYQFLPHAEPIVRKLLAAARRTVIIAEPIRNVSASGNPLLSILGRRMTVPASEAHTYSGGRFNQGTLTTLFQSFEAFERAVILPGGREMMGIFKGQCDCQ